MNEDIAVTLTKDEAWVLFEFVRRFSNSDKLSIDDQAEERALWNLCCTLEKSLHQEGDIEYDQFIKECRDRLRDEA